MDVLIITFELVDLDEAGYRQQAASIAPVFLAVPGLIAKTWLAEPAHNTYGGVYLFKNRASLEAYLASEIVASMRSNPHFGALSVHAFGTVEAATEVTGDLLTATGPAATIGSSPKPI